jgi:DNA repair ATPase RecN
MQDDDTDDETFFNTLNESIIPAHKKYVEKVTAIKPKTQEVRALHEIMIEAINTRMSALVTMLDALDKQDYSLVNQANEKINKVDKLTRDFHVKLADLAKDHKVNYTEKDTNS